MCDKEPIYRVQRMALEAAFGQAMTNILRRIFGMPITKKAKEAEVDFLREHNLPEAFATWKVRSHLLD